MILEFLGEVIGDSHRELSDRIAALRLLPLVPSEEWSGALAQCNAVGTNELLPHKMLREAGRTRARLDLQVGRSLTTDDLVLADFCGAAYVSYDAYIAAHQRRERR